MRHTLYDMFADSCRKHSSNVALVDEETRLDYRELLSTVESAAHDLSLKGVGEQQRIGLLFPNGAEFVVAFFALRLLDAVPVPVNWRLTASEAARQISAARVTTVLHSVQFTDLAEDIGSQKPETELVLFSLAGAKEDEADCRQANNAFRQSETDYGGDSLALILFTSGSTGAAKAVAYTDASLVIKVLAFQSGQFPYTEDDSFLLFNPLFHQGGLSFLLFLLMAGSKTVLRKKLSSTHIAELLEKEKITHLLLLPPSLCSHISSNCKSSNKKFPFVRCVTLAGGKNANEAIDEIFDLFPESIIRIGYGQTEGIASASVHFDKATFSSDPTIAQSIGTPDPLCSIVLLDKKKRLVADGEIGQAWGWSPAMFSGYLNIEDECENGWFPTGDLMKIRSDGRLEFIGRTRDMIKTGGENVFAQEVERILESHPLVEEAAVVRSSDPKLGESIAAALAIADTNRPSPQSLLSFFIEHAASYKKPRELLFLSKLPRTSTGKIDKRALEKQFADKENPEIWRLS